MSTKIEDLKPEAQGAAARALHALAEKSIQVVVTYTLRTYDEQSALYAQGREPLLAVNARRDRAGLPPIVASENTYTVTNADGIKIADGGKGRSAHQLGTAIDVVPDFDPSEAQRPAWPPVTDPRWLQIAQAFEAEGFEWGGRWTLAKDGIGPDCPHYQLKA